MNNRTLDMTRGKPLPLIISFAMPLMLGNVFQQMYSVVDTAIVGKALGVGALAALGATDWLNWMLLSIVQGLAQGFGILMAQHFGARKIEELRRTVGTSIVLSAGCSVLLTLLGQLIVVPVLTLLNTPEDVMPGGVMYLRVMFGGLPIVMAYNLLATVLRSVGDGKSPLYAMIVASIINIGLDLLFVLVFHWGIPGAAAATLIAQLCAAGYCLLRLWRDPQLRLGREDLKPEASLMGRLLRLGAPVAGQNSVISIGGMIIQLVINGYGVVFIAAFAATNKLYGMLEIAAISYGYAMLTYTGQNLGAGKMDRIYSGIRKAAVMALATSGVIMAAMLIFGKWIVSCFISGTPQEVEEAVKIAYENLSVMSIFLPVLYLLHVYRSAIQGTGNTVLPMASGVMEFVMRITAVFLLPRFFGRWGIYYAEIMAWLGCMAVLIPGFYRVMKKACVHFCSPVIE